MRRKYMQHKKWLGIAAGLISGMMIFSACSAAVPGGILASMRELPRVRLADAEAHPLTQAALAVLQALPPDTDLEGVRIAQAQEQTDEDASETEDQNGEMSEDELVSMGEEVYMAN